ncbi:MAG: CRTAC1 family protein [Planctomycetota bacterium]|nr:CRTAC1 family protein [Planctomycetota bacterium]
MKMKTTPSNLCTSTAQALGCAALSVLLLISCDERAQSSSPALFEDVTAPAGLEIPLTSGGDPLNKSSILEVNGNGAALVDLDNDGDLDVILVDGSTHERILAGDPVHHHVLLNQGVEDGIPRFTPATETGLVMNGWPTGVVSGDVDRDGRPDLVIGGHGEDALFLNRTEIDGPLHFEKHTLPGRTGPLDWTTSLSMADADNDGQLDLYLVRYLDIDPKDLPTNVLGDVPCLFEGHPVLCGPHGMTAQADVFLRGLHNGPPWFEVATEPAGLASVPPSYGLGILFMDLDIDGDVDLYVANDSVDNFLFRNDGTGHFEELGALSGAVSDASGRPQAGMGVDAADWDQDGDLDLVVTNFSDESNTLYRNEGELHFRDVSTGIGLTAASRPLLGWGVHMRDFNADGLTDLFFSNGHVYPQADQPDTSSSYAQPLVLLLGEPGGRLGSNVFPDLRTHRGRGALVGDVDNDGDLDLLVLRLDDSPRLFLNGTNASERQMVVTLEGDARSGPDAYGATFTLETSAGKRVAQKTAATGFQSHGDTRLYLTLPPDEKILSASVLWPGGNLEQLELDSNRLRAGQSLVVRQGSGIISSSPLRNRAR